MICEVIILYGEIFQVCYVVEYVRDIIIKGVFVKIDYFQVCQVVKKFRNWIC